jgi:putative transposase
LRTAVRLSVGKNAQLSAAIVDSQSVKTTDRGGVHGYDAGKKTNGRKRPVLVDTLGLVWLVVVTAAGTQARDGARTLLAVLATPMRRLRLIWADGA